MQTTARIVTGVTTASILIYSVSQALQGRMTVGQVLLVHSTAANLFAPIMQLPQISRIGSHMQVALARLMDVLERTPDIRDAPDARPLPRPLREGIHVHNLSFNYGETEGEDSEMVIRNISLEVPAGHWLCLMGGSGSGKTTLLFLLARLYRANSGIIAYDSIPLEKITMASLRQAVGFVPQVPQVFSGTVRDNITYGRPEATPEEIMQAARMAELHDFIMGMKVQYETIIGERGTSLSGGQRQRLALARALLTNPDILILDDCTSALDADTERKIQQTLTQTLAGKTAVIASQRISMACRCHRIAVLDNGVISEYGTHEELLRSDGFYARLHAQQVG